MATAQDIIKRAFRTARILAEGEELESYQANDGLTYLNDLIENLSTQEFMIYQKAVVTHTMDGSTSYTIGPGGDINVPRPLQIFSAFFTQIDVDYPVRVITKEEYDGFSFKTSTSDIVDYVYLFTDYPLATVFVYPVATSGTLTLNVWQVLDTVPTLTTELSLPPGYERMLRYNLAMELIDEYGLEPSPNLMMKANESVANLKRVNTKQGVLSVMLPIEGHGIRSQIERGY